MSHCVQEQPDTLDLDEPVILTIAQKQMMPSITCGTDLVFHRETRSTMDASKPEPNHGPDAPPGISFYTQGANCTIPHNVREDLKKYHDAIFNSMPPLIPPCKWKSLFWLKPIIGGLPSMLKRVLGIPHTENFQRKVHVEIDVPGVHVADATLNVFFDMHSPFDYISEKCATEFGFAVKSDAAHPIKHVRWHVEEDENLKEPRLYFNDRKYEEGEFRYARFLGKFDLIIGWNTIQALKLLEPKDDIAAAGEGFRQLPPSVDKDAARRNQSAVAATRAQEWEAMEQHREREERKTTAAAATATSKNNGHSSI